MKGINNAINSVHVTGNNLSHRISSTEAISFLNDGVGEGGNSSIRVKQLHHMRPSHEQELQLILLWCSKQLQLEGHT